MNSQGPLTVSALARQLGVAPSTLRTWDRRYGVGPSSHDVGANRLYTPADVALLTAMRKLVIMGVPPADAAARAKAGFTSVPVEPTRSASACPHVDSSQAENLYRAAQAFNREIVEAIIRDEIKANGVVEAWNCVLTPLLIRIGEQWASDGTGIGSEHFVSEIIKRVLGEPIAELTNPINSRPVLVACIGEEVHSLAVRALVATLAERQIESQFLGAQLPQVALNEVIKKSAPPAIFLWAQLAAHADLEYVHQLPTLRPAPRIIVGGPGWQGTACSDATYTFDLEHAAQEISRAIGA
ncbi:MAG: MerR family transcriptional regulator [Actinomycetes bacterium]